MAKPPGGTLKVKGGAPALFLVLAGHVGHVRGAGPNGCATLGHVVSKGNATQRESPLPYRDVLPPKLFQTGECHPPVSLVGRGVYRRAKLLAHPIFFAARLPAPPYAVDIRVSPRECRKSFFKVNR